MPLSTSVEEEGEDESVNSDQEDKRRQRRGADGGRRESYDRYLSISKINALKNSVNGYCDEIAKLLLSSKETAERKRVIESAFRVCKEAFLEVATMLTCCVESGPSDIKIRSAVMGALTDLGLVSDKGGNGKYFQGGRGSEECDKTYASAVRSVGTTVQILGGPVIDVPKAKNFYILPDNNAKNRYASSMVTRDKFTFKRFLSQPSMDYKLII